MARTTKADLEKRIAELEEENKKLLNILNEDNQKYSELVEQKTSEFHKLPEYQSMKKDIAQLEEIKRVNEATIQRKKKIESDLRNKIQELLTEIEQLKSAKNEILINGSTYQKKVGRKPKSKDITQQQIHQIESYLADGKTGKEISSLMDISERTYYRLKKLLKDKQS